MNKKSKITSDEFIKRAKEVHGEKYDYSKVKYVDGITKVTIICPEHGEFMQTPVAHLKGHGFPKPTDRNNWDSWKDFLNTDKS
jgi:hypothetical protein